MDDSLDIVLSDRKNFFEDSIEKYWANRITKNVNSISHLVKSIQYSCANGGKRFRPVLAILIAESFAVNPSRVMPFAISVEFIHSYSLIHDDLPCMDNDDFRRGQPTNHKVFGESTGLLAGDSLLTEAFSVLADAYSEEPHVAIRLIKCVSEASGIRGMIGGQAIDLFSKKSDFDKDEIICMHQLKTGALISCSAEGAAILCGLPQEKVKLCKEFGESLGLCFQIKDDLLDSTVESLEAGSLPAKIGIDETFKLLQSETQKAFESLNKMGITSGALVDLVKYNLQRET